MERIVTLGEIMLRLKAPGHERLLQSPSFEATFGGSEANVAVSLTHFGMAASFVTSLPDNAIGDAALAELRRFGVDVSNVVRSGDRVGIYYLEAGADQRRTRVVYDRTGSAIAEASPQSFDWAAVFEEADWFHISAITPALSEQAAALSLEACRQARAHGVRISCDFNYRAMLWRYGRAAPEVMSPIVELVDVGIANEDNCRRSLGIHFDSDRAGAGIDRYEQLAERVIERFPNLETLALTIRETQSADRTRWSACLRSDGKFVTAPEYQIEDIVDRVGGGDGFAAGLIYGLLRTENRADALAFATAAGCLKHSISGDFNRVSAEEVLELVAGDATGIVQR
ncbi:MAG: sugar kinase [Gammaproteobacteria bacterium]|jgi:2-dehydro-3-deoxygluconokinase